MRSCLRIVPFFVFVGFFGCSSSDSTPSAPTQACNQVLDETCAALERCGVESKSTCISATSGPLDCSKAVGTSGNLQACLDALPKVDCASFPPLPAVCQGVILEQRSVVAPTAPETPATPATNPLARTIASP